MFFPLLAAILAVAPPQAPLPIHTGGRVVAQKDGALAFGWPGTYFEGRFRGTGVEVAAESATEFMRILVDGQEKALLRRPGTARLRLEDLPLGDHVVRLEKQTESQSGGGRFLGFRVLDGDPLPPVPRSRQIEYIGDSYTVGYGNTSPGPTCTEEEVHNRTDTQRAFGPLLAKTLDADYRVNAYSGFGIVRNYNGGSAGESLPRLYPRLIPGEPAHREAGRGDWRPQLIVVNLGTNDFSTPLRAGEAWPNQQALRSAYRAAYVAFAKALIAAQPQAKLILMASDDFLAEVQQVASTLNTAAPRKAAILRFGGLDLTGCHSHPSLADHEKLAASLAGTIAGIPDLWSRKGR